jgi:putative acetyltransferase
LRARGKHVLSLVAVDGAEVVGHLLLTKVRIEGSVAAAPLLLGLGPVAVRTDRQRQGIGDRLTRAALGAARETGAAGIVVLGHPAYYPRFGFVPARDFGLHCVHDPSGGAFFAQELHPLGLAGVSGLVRYAAEFDAT